MSAGLLVAVAIITAASRVVAMALLPAPTGRAAVVIQRLPAPLFASLAALSVADALEGSAGTPAPLLVAVGCAVVASARRSLLLTLLADLGGYGLAAMTLA